MDKNNQEKAHVEETIRNISQLSSRMNQLNLYAQNNGILDPNMPTQTIIPPPPKEGDPIEVNPTAGSAKPGEYKHRQLQGLQIGTTELVGNAGKIIGALYRNSQTMQEAQLRVAREKTAKMLEPILPEEELEAEGINPNSQNEESQEEKIAEKPVEKPPENIPQHEYAYQPVVDARL